jgi:hypothetical protein
MSNNQKNAFSEKTVVQTRPNFEDSPNNGSNHSDQADQTNEVDQNDESSSRPQSGDRTVVYAQSNLKETFDARTVVRSSKPVAQAATAAKTSRKFVPPTEEIPMLPPAETPVPDARVEAASAPLRNDSELALNPKKSLTPDERRLLREALDRKKSRMIAAFAAFCTVVILGLLVAFNGPKSNETIASKGSEKKSIGEKSDLASEAPAAGKKLRDAENFVTTTDVLEKFDHAAQKSQERALDYSKSSSGF